MNNSLLSYLPAQVIKCVLDGKISSNPRYPIEIPLETVSLFADISGFTKLSERFSKEGRSDVIQWRREAFFGFLFLFLF